MTALDSVLIAGPPLTGTIKQATPSNAQATIDAAADGTEVRLAAGSYPRLNVRSKRIRIVLEDGAVISGGGQSLGIWFDHPRTCELIGQPGSLVRNPDGTGVQGDGGTLILSRLTVKECFEQGVLVKSAGGSLVQLDRSDLSDCGREGALSWIPEPGYWRYGVHCAYLAADDSGTPTKAIVVGNRFHDQHCGYGLQLGGQAREGTIAYNMFERIDAVADPTESGDRNGNGVHVFSSYLGSRGNLIVNTLGRQVRGYAVCGQNDTSQGVARQNVAFGGAGVLLATYGGKTSLTDGGGNIIRDLPSLAACVAAGVFDPEYVPAWAPAPPPPQNLVLEALNREWQVWLEKTGSTGKKTQAENWRLANQGEYDKLLTYRNGGPKPTLVTSFGRQMVEHVTAWIKAGGLP